MSDVKRWSSPQGPTSVGQGDMNDGVCHRWATLTSEERLLTQRKGGGTEGAEIEPVGEARHRAARGWKRADAPGKHRWVP
jgi:hypothetical protein